MRRVGDTIAKECVAEHVTVLLGPGLNIKRHPLCGRNFEYFSEDPYLTGKLAAAFVNGVIDAVAGSVVRPEQVLSLAGDAARGRRVFFEAAGVQCKNCHRVGKEGQEVGPELTAIGKKFDRAQLLESILEPSKRVDPKYVTYLVETNKGQLVSGLLVTKDASEVVLKDAQNKVVRIPAEQVDYIGEPFYRGDPSRTRHTGGTGLGLYLARELCEGNQASLNLIPTQQGGRFRITFSHPHRQSAIPA